MNSYLWDRSGAPDHDIVELESLLLRYRGKPQVPPVVPVRVVPERRWLHSRTFFAAAAAVLLIAGFVAVTALWKISRASVAFSASGGDAPSVNGRPLASGRLRPGDTVRTSSNGGAELRVGELGRITIAPNSVVTLVESRSRRQRFRLAHGEIQARINADPGVFIVDTPSARAVDLGCAYTLRMEPSGEGEIRVSEGWVSVDYDLRKSLVPAGWMASVARGGLISPPYAQATSVMFRDALLAWWRSERADPVSRQRSFAELLRNAQKRDAWTLLAMLARSAGQERAALYDRLNELVPAPPEVSREAVIRGEPNAEDAWWGAVHRELGISWMKKKGPLNIDLYQP